MRRIDYLDGLRGLSALAVMLQHFALAFGLSSWPLGVITSGDTALFLFFILSGAVLTPSFSRAPDAPGANLLGRVARLWPPVMAAVAISILLTRVVPHRGAEAAVAAASDWLAAETAQAPSPALIIAETAGLTMPPGYRETGLFAPVAALMPSQTASIDPPIWSLHVELWGSLLLIALIWVRSRSRASYWALLAAAAAMIGVNELGLFLVGHLCQRFAQSAAYARVLRSRVTLLAATLLVELGVFGCWVDLLRGVPWAEALIHASDLHIYSWFGLQHELGAVAIFVGVLLSPDCQRALSMRVPRLLGRLSFSIYLLHWPVMLGIGSAVFLAALPLGQTAAGMLAVLAALLATLALSRWFERWCDRPAVRLSQAIRARAASRRAPSIGTG
jgi:peptidoglycan/LPS O-acetylase OafA/YrhL